MNAVSVQQSGQVASCLCERMRLLEACRPDQRAQFSHYLHRGVNPGGLADPGGEIRVGCACAASWAVVMVDSRPAVISRMGAAYDHQCMVTDFGQHPDSGPCCQCFGYQSMHSRCRPQRGGGDQRAELGEMPPENSYAVSGSTDQFCSGIDCHIVQPQHAPRPAAQPEWLDHLLFQACLFGVDDRGTDPVVRAWAQQLARELLSHDGLPGMREFASRIGAV